MKKYRKSMLSTVLAVFLAMGNIGGISVLAEEPKLTSEQQNAIAMLNYMSFSKAV